MYVYEKNNAEKKTLVICPLEIWGQDVKFSSFIQFTFLIFRKKSNLNILLCIYEYMPYYIYQIPQVTLVLTRTMSWF